MKDRLSQMSKKAITRRIRYEYRVATKKEKGEILDHVCATIGWSRDNARRQLKNAIWDGRQKVKTANPTRLKYSSCSRQILENVWNIAGNICGQYLKYEIDHGILERLVKLKELRHGKQNKGKIVLNNELALRELHTMSSATIDRYLKPARHGLLGRSLSTTRASSFPLKNEIPFGKS
jgi:hypothetical protein